MINIYIWTDIEKVESSSAHRTAIDEQSLFCPNMLLEKSRQLHKHVIFYCVHSLMKHLNI